MELAGAIDSQCIGEDAGQVLLLTHMIPCTPSHAMHGWHCIAGLPLCLYLSHTSFTRILGTGVVVQISGMDEPLEIPVLNDLTMVLGSIAQVQTPLSSLGARRP